MYCDKEMLLSIVGEVKKGDLVRIKTCFEKIPGDAYNTILIINDKGELKAVWYDGEYAGSPYVILDYQIITQIVERDVNVEQYFENIKLKKHNDVKSEKSFLRK